ncbi:MAG TPA: LutB/LldF family L-lactate oxidation iron-sulfur protein [Alphaproteobacteria bacterium]|jgi:L-lactate dehydrogenase complex protein LldF|nr:LutB/LldF family L-lactate oxidation iron-sulfur protein [Alphaproteobacteria bacterium]
MQPTSHDFIARANKGLADDILQQALARFQTGFTVKRAEAAARLPEFEALRDQAVEIKNHTLEHLDFYLERFADKVEHSGGEVHWCVTPGEARQTVLDICRAAGAKTVTKSKSMIGEEIALNRFLEDHDIEPVETDLGEYIVQLAEEYPSHIIAPAVHKTKDQIADLFYERHKGRGADKKLHEVDELVAEARAMLRQRFIAADVGITGANFLISETGTTAIVTNEGNGDLTQILPRVHIVLATLEKVVPTLDDMSTILRVLARSATGQEFSTYTTLSTGPKRPGDLDGPEAFHVILLDNGRSRILGSEFRELLRCIKCGACMNHCPVYGSIGGHAYGWVYPGPVGAVLTPHLVGLEEAHHLPNASTFCGRCEEVCPMRIPLPGLMRRWRQQEFDAGLQPLRQRLGLAIWAWLVRRPASYRLASALAMRALRLFGARRGRLANLPFAHGWTVGRDMPAPEGGSFHAQWRRRRRGV